MRNIFLKRKSTFSVLLSAILLLCALSAPASADTLEPTVSEPFDDDTHIALVQTFWITITSILPTGLNTTMRKLYLPMVTKVPLFA